MRRFMWDVHNYAILSKILHLIPRPAQIVHFGLFFLLRLSSIHVLGIWKEKPLRTALKPLQDQQSRLALLLPSIAWFCTTLQVIRWLLNDGKTYSHAVIQLWLFLQRNSNECLACPVERQIVFHSQRQHTHTHKHKMSYDKLCRVSKCPLNPQTATSAVSIKEVSLNHLYDDSDCHCGIIELRIISKVGETFSL